MDDHRKSAESPHRVIIAGAGVAGLEAMLTLHALAGDRLNMTILDSAAELVFETGSVEVPFELPGSRAYRLDTICEDHGAELRNDALQRVCGYPRSIVTRAGDELPYDSLVVAVGAQRLPVFQDALTFRGSRDTELVHGLLQEVEGGLVRRLSFVVPPGVTWSLPLYELALMTARRASNVRPNQVEITIVTPERRPLEMFGDEMGDAVTRAVDEAGIRMLLQTNVAGVRYGVLSDAAGVELTRAERVLALPTLRGPRIAGLPADDLGFIPSDLYTRVDGLRGVYAVGDSSNQPIKQGGVGAQQAEVAARQIATRAGRDLEQTPFHPVLRAKLLTGGDALYVRRQAADLPGVIADRPLWWPPAKVVAPHLAAYLERRDEGHRGPAAAPGVAVIHAQGDPTGGIELLG